MTRSARVVMFVLNPVRFDRRVIREAGSLAASGCAVTVYGVADRGTGVIERELHPDGFEIVRVPMRGTSSLWRSLHATPPGHGLTTAGGVGAVQGRATSGLGEQSAGSRRMRTLAGMQFRWVLNARRRWWAWGRAVIADVGPADVYHGHDLPGLGVAVHARRRYGGQVVYDSHDLFLEAGANATRPRIVRRLLRAIEAGWYREADMLVTVNDEIANRLLSAYGPKPHAVVHNCVPRWRPTDLNDGDPLRRLAGLPIGTPVVLYHGGFTANRGLGLLMQAMLEPGLEACHLVLLGYGPMGAELERLAALERYAGRVHVLPPVAPESLDRHVACADVAAMVNQPASENELLSTPNKLFESIAAGVPVVTSDFPMRRRIVIDDPAGPLGAVCDPTDPVSIGAALREVLRLPPAQRRDIRDRCLRAAHERWNWEHESEELIEAYGNLLDLLPQPSSTPVHGRIM